MFFLQGGDECFHDLYLDCGGRSKFKFTFCLYKSKSSGLSSASTNKT